MATALAAAGAIVAPAGAGVAGAAVTNHVGYSASVFGSRASGSAAVASTGSGKSAWTVVGCTTQPGLHPQDSTSQVNLPGGNTANAVSTNATTSFDPATSTASINGTASTGQVSLFNGIISAKAIQATTSASANESGGNAHGQASVTFVGLTVAGVSRVASPPPNKTIKLGNYGEVILNSQHVGAKPGYLVSTTAEAMVVKITAPNNPTGLPAGSQMVLAHSFVGLSGPVAHGTVGRVAYGTELSNSKVVNSGPSFPEPLGCFGTDGKTLTNKGSALATPLVGTGTITDTAMGIDHRAQPIQANLSSQVSSAQIGTGGVPGVPSIPGLPGVLLKADTVNASSNLTTTNGVPSWNENGSELIGLQVAGKSAPSSLPPVNTSMSIPNVGTLYLNRVLKSNGGSTEEVRMIELQITNSALASAVGSPDVRIAVAVAHS